MSVTNKRPQLTSMEGMIWNANHTLGYALNPGIRGIPKGYFMNCAGICILNTVQAGFMFSGSVGTGIFMKRDGMTGSWSNPVACGVSGVGFGVLIGASVKEVIIFMADDASVQTFFSKGFKVAAQNNVTIGVGRDLEGSFGISGSGLSWTISIAYTKGAFVGATMEGAVVVPRKGANEAFYGPGNGGSPADIIEGKVAFPIGKTTMFDEVRDKLDKLSKGMSETLGEAEQKKAEAAITVADKAAQAIADSEEVVHIDAAAEAAKGN